MIRFPAMTTIVIPMSLFRMIAMTVMTVPMCLFRAMVMTALLAALACVATLVIRIPSPTGGYMNLGDTVVLLSAYLLGPAWGAVAAGLGSALADLFSGYTAYVPATLLIKALMAAAAAHAGGDYELVKQILDTITTEEAVGLLKEAGLLEPAMSWVTGRIHHYLNHRAYDRLKIGAVIFSNEYGYLGETPCAGELKDILRAGQET